jgi:hypothetical protein
MLRYMRVSILIIAEKTRQENNKRCAVDLGSLPLLLSTPDRMRGHRDLPPNDCVPVAQGPLRLGHSSPSLSDADMDGAGTAVVCCNG